MATHTPGPWTYRDSAGAGLEICGPIQRGQGVDIPHGMPEVIHFFSLTAPQNILIACERWVQFEPKGWHEMQVANARLITAAPDLLAALRAVIAVADRKTDEFDLARAAIAKAATP